MSGIRSITRRNDATAFYASSGSTPLYVNQNDSSVRVVGIAGSGTGESQVMIGVSAITGAFRTAAGTGTLVSGTVVVATGLSTVVGFGTTLAGTGARGTGTTEVAQLTVTSITTGAVSVTGMYSTAAATWVASASGTSAFYWFAIGT